MPSCNSENSEKQTFSLIENETKMRMLKMIDCFASSIFAVPYLSSHPCVDARAPKSIHDIKEKLKKNGYINTRQVFQDIDVIFSKENHQDSFKTHVLFDNGEIERSTVVFLVDKEKIAQEMKAKLAREAQNLFIDEQVRAVPMARKILAVLKNRFPNISETHLKLAAFKLVCNQEGEWKNLVQELHQENENMKPGAIYQKFSFFPSKDVEMTGEYAIHQCIACFHFYRMMPKWTEPSSPIPVPLRKVCTLNVNIKIVF